MASYIMRLPEFFFLHSKLSLDHISITTDMSAMIKKNIPKLLMCTDYVVLPSDQNKRPIRD